MPPSLVEIQKLYSPYPGFHIWEFHEIFRGELNPQDVYIPKVNDLVIDVPGNKQYKVSHVDMTTGESTLVVWNPMITDGNTDGLDKFVTTGPGTSSEAFRIYINTNTLPYTLAFDDRVRIYSSDSIAVKVFLGVNITNDPIVVSAHYNQSGVLIGENIPLELVATANYSNVSIKRPIIANANRVIADGDTVTAVVYGANGGVLSTAQFIIKNTNFIRAVSDSTKYVTGITIKSPFISPTDIRVINYPINVTVDTSHLMGVVHYNSGSTKEYPIDGIHFTLPGINEYVSSQAGISTPLVLQYQLGADEMSYGLGVAPNGIISEPYSLVSTAPTGVYAVKLFGYPRWLDATRGYLMEYHLYNLDRDMIVPVTTWVNLAANSAAFMPKQYGTTQEFTVSINLNDINPMYAEYVHVQTFTVVLNNAGSSSAVPNWSIGYEANQNPRYGVNVVATAHMVSGVTWDINIGCGFPTKEVWLQKLYHDTKPIFNPATELGPLVPTHAELVFKNFSMEITTAQWNDNLIAPNDLDHGEVLGIRWIRRTVNGDLQLAYSGLPVHIV